MSCQENPGRKARVLWQIPALPTSYFLPLPFPKPNSLSSQGSQNMAALRASRTLGGRRGTHFPREMFPRRKYIRSCKVMALGPQLTCRPISFANI